MIGREPLPVLLALGPQQVVLVRQRPPHVREGGEPAHDIAEVALVDRGSQVGEAPAVVGVEQDEVRLDAELAELRDAPLEPAEVRGVEALEVEALLERPGKAKSSGSFAL